MTQFSTATGIPSGHMPHTVNLPFTEMLDPQTKTMKSKDELEKVFTTAGVDFSKPIVASCGSGRDQPARSYSHQLQIKDLDSDKKYSIKLKLPQLGIM